MKFQLTTLALATGLTLSGAAQASLLERDLDGNGSIDAYYDTALGITWQKDANLAASNTFGVSGISGAGRMDTLTAPLWIAAMNTANYLGYNDWRLPSALNMDGSGPCLGFDCTNSEMGYLFYTEGGVTQGQSITSSATLLATFSNLQSYAYWDSQAGSSPLSLWFFRTTDGNQSFIAGEGNAWAVRTGDVAAAPAPSGVPEPETLGLLAIGLLGLGLARRRG